MSYIPTRDRFHFPDEVTEALSNLADTLERAAAVAHHDDECHCADPDRVEQYHSYAGYLPYPLEVLADLYVRGMLNPPPLKSGQTVTLDGKPAQVMAVPAAGEYVIDVDGRLAALSPAEVVLRVQPVAGDS